MARGWHEGDSGRREACGLGPIRERSLKDRYTRSVAELTIATLNLRGVHDSWLRREPLVIAGLAKLQPDVLCLQEAATWCLQAHWVAWRLSRRTGRKYRVSFAPKRGYRGLFEGVAILSALPAGRHRTLALGGSGRVAQRVVAKADGRPVVVVNAHLEHRSRSAALRGSQVESILGWLKDSTHPAVVAGDFNDVPDSPALAALSPGFRSVFSGLDVQLVGTSPAREPHRIIDYIMAVEGVEVMDAGKFLDEPQNGRWPSDHIGLWAKIRI